MMRLQIAAFLISLLISLTLQHREKRYIFVNPTSPITLGFILNLPISLALPTLVFDGRALDAVLNFPLEGDFPDELISDPNYAEPLDRVGVYFSYMQIPTLSCQERIICELAADPDSYSPISDIILKEIRLKYGPVTKANDSLMWRYLVSAREGFSSTAQECGARYSKCPVPAHKLLNMPVIKVWQFLSDQLNIKLIY